MRIGEKYVQAILNDKPGNNAMERWLYANIQVIKSKHSSYLVFCREDVGPRQATFRDDEPALDR
jgi:hypothetical protein